MESGLSPVESIAYKAAVLECAVRALIATHPEPDKLRQAFQSLIAQVQAHRAGVPPAHLDFIRQSAELLFAPPVELQ